MPNFHELVNNVASQISNNSAGEVWFTNLDLKNAYSQLSLDNFTSSQCNFSLVGGDITGSYQFLTSFMDPAICRMNFKESWSFNHHKKIVYKSLFTLDSYNFAVKWAKCKFFQKKWMVRF